MSKYCPIINSRVTYLDCIDCDEKSCCNSSSDIGQEDEKIIKENNKEKENEKL